MSKPSSNTPHSRQVFFLDENLGANRLSEILRAGGYTCVTHRERYGLVRGIPDDQLIADCGETNTILLTADAELETAWAAEILQAKVRVVILSNNTDGAVKWGERLTNGREGLLAQLHEQKKPFAIRFNSRAEITHVRVYRKTGSKVIMIKQSKKKKAVVDTTGC